MMPNLYEMLGQAQEGEAVAEIGREFGLSPQQTQAAIGALLPAISMGLKRSTETPEGLSNLFALMGGQPGLYAIYDDPDAASLRRDAPRAIKSWLRCFGRPMRVAQLLIMRSNFPELRRLSLRSSCRCLPESSSLV